jgi:pimeloyl-ACP methyl ester carboxylesterase
MLGIVGTRDTYVASFRALAAIMPSLQLILIEGATHSAAAARPEFLQAVADFLARHREKP